MAYKQHAPDLIFVEWKGQKHPFTSATGTTSKINWICEEKRQKEEKGRKPRRRRWPSYPSLPLIGIPWGTGAEKKMVHSISGTQLCILESSLYSPLQVFQQRAAVKTTKVSYIHKYILSSLSTLLHYFHQHYITDISTMWCFAHWPFAKKECG